MSSKARKLGKGVIVVSAHVGNIDKSGASASIQGYPVNAVVKDLGEFSRIAGNPGEIGLEVPMDPGQVFPLVPGHGQGCNATPGFRDTGSCRRRIPVGAASGKPWATDARAGVGATRMQR